MMMLNPSQVLCSRGSILAMSATENEASSPQKKIVNVRIKGRVQGVFYRQWTMDTARQLGLDGWVRNCADGSVEALFCGRPNDVQSMIHRCRTGPSSSRVSDVESKPIELLEFDDTPKGFHIKPSI